MKRLTIGDVMTRRVVTVVPDTDAAYKEPADRSPETVGTNR